ncbi:hypothetical protein KPB2_5524 [Klebsiella pneumoniae Kb677]|nr:hypothetical protein KPB2_5524 [Klebsiella pneumoniae Kb677]
MPRLSPPARRLPSRRACLLVGLRRTAVVGQAALIPAGADPPLRAGQPVALPLAETEPLCCTRPIAVRLGRPRLALGIGRHEARPAPGVVSL